MCFVEFEKIYVTKNCLQILLGNADTIITSTFSSIGKAVMSPTQSWISLSPLLVTTNMRLAIFIDIVTDLPEQRSCRSPLNYSANKDKSFTLVKSLWAWLLQFIMQQENVCILHILNSCGLTILEKIRWNWRSMIADTVNLLDT